MKKDAVRVWSIIPESVNAELEKLTKRYGFTKSVLISFAIQAGLRSIVRAINPEDVFSPAQWAEIFAKLGEVGVDLKEFMGGKSG